MIGDAQAGARRVTVMTYNIRNGHPDPGHEWADRAPLVADVVRRALPDVWGAQEVLRHQRDDLEQMLPEYAVFGQGRGGGDVDEFVPVLWRRDRFDAVDAGQFWLSDTPDVVASDTWHSLCVRCTTWVRLQPRGGGAEFVFATTHLDHEENAHGDDVRARSARLIAGRMRGLSGPVILTGDFNTVRGSAAWTTFMDAGFRDAGGGADAPTFHDYRRAEHPVAIDWILTANGAAATACRVECGGEAARASDHYPVVAECTVDGQASRARA